MLKLVIVKKAHNSRIYSFQTGSSTLCFRFSAVQAIFELEKGLAHRIREGDFSRINEGDRPYSPSLKKEVRNINENKYNVCIPSKLELHNNQVYRHLTRGNASRKSYPIQVRARYAIA